jgi:para-aminobenzoate synthetase component 1
VKQKNIEYLNNIDHFIWLNGNYHSDGLVAVGCKYSLILNEPKGAFEQLRAFLELHKGEYVFGYLSYELKNDIEDSPSKNPSNLDFPVLQFLVPETVIHLPAKGTDPNLITGNLSHLRLFNELLQESEQFKNTSISISGQLKSNISKEHYLNQIERAKKHIQLGDIYELNYCYDFSISDLNINPWELYVKFNSQSRASFSAFVKLKEHFIVSASPERFIKKEGNKITSQPIKGTIKRGKDLEEDEELKLKLQQDPKERRENIMIVDLVRNDLSKIAKKGTVKVEELCEIYTFDTLHQMISTVSCEMLDEVDLVSVFKALFPMGSMTGVPKIRAMELIDELEITKRGVYSGSLGYISPSGDADFNVVIRSFLYNNSERNLSYSVGSAITNASDPEKEFDETLLKAKLARTLFSNESPIS